MGSPYKRYVNLTLYVPQGTGAFVRNPVTGNREQTTSIVTVKCSVEPDNLQTKNKMLPGADHSTIYLDGNYVIPKYKPTYIQHNAKYDADYYDPQTKTNIRGTFTLDVPIQSRFRAVSRALGSNISGWFQCV